MQDQEITTPQLLGAIQAHGALLESLIVNLCVSKIADNSIVDALFAHARAQFAKPYMAASGGETTHVALEVLEEMQTRVVGRARAMS